MADKTIEFTLCGFTGDEADTVFFKINDPTILASNYSGGTLVVDPKYYLIKATITAKTVLSCKYCKYTFTYNDTVLAPGKTLDRTKIDLVDLWNANTQYIKEIIAKNNLEDSI